MVKARLVLLSCESPPCGVAGIDRPADATPELDDACVAGHSGSTPPGEMIQKVASRGLAGKVRASIVAMISLIKTQGFFVEFYSKDIW